MWTPVAQFLIGDYQRSSCWRSCFGNASDSCLVFLFFWRLLGCLSFWRLGERLVWTLVVRVWLSCWILLGGLSHPAVCRTQWDSHTCPTGVSEPPDSETHKIWSIVNVAPWGPGQWVGCRYGPALWTIHVLLPSQDKCRLCCLHNTSALLSAGSIGAQIEPSFLEQ